MNKGDVDATSYINGLKSANEQEFSFRMAIAL